jgi:hypothetical protein
MCSREAEMTQFDDNTPVNTDKDGMIEYAFNLGHHTANVEEQTRNLTKINEELDDIILRAKTLWSPDEFKAMIERAKNRLDAMNTGEVINFDEVSK